MIERVRQIIKGEASEYPQQGYDRHEKTKAVACRPGSMEKSYGVFKLDGVITLKTSVITKRSSPSPVLGCESTSSMFIRDLRTACRAQVSFQVVPGFPFLFHDRNLLPATPNIWLKTPKNGTSK